MTLTQIADLVPGPCPELVATVESVSEPFTTPAGRVGQTLIVMDATGQLKVTLWGDRDTTHPTTGKRVPPQVGLFRPGDHVRLLNILIKEYSGTLEATTGYSGRILKLQGGAA